MQQKSSRRRFLGQSAAITTGFWLGASSESRASQSPNEKLNVAFIAAGGRARSNIKAIQALKQNVVAFSDVDDERAAEAYKANPKVPHFKDFRKMLDEVKGIDAVVVSTPDHMHAPASMDAMKRGKHVYCEKPLTHSMYEAKLLRDTAAKAKVATQMGNLGTGYSGFRSGVEVIRSGVLGHVHTVHVWTDRPGKYWKQGLDTPTAHESIPPTLDWELWLGPVASQPYHRVFCPHDWRGWFDFGCGSLGDMGCHTANLPYMGLQLGTPTSISAETSEPKPDCFPAWAIITYEFPARGAQPPVKFIWYDGGKTAPVDLMPGKKLVKSGCLLVGEKGNMFSPDDYGVTHKLFPEESFANITPPKASLPRQQGGQLAHYSEWIQAIKTGSNTLTNFDYATRLTEVCLLGNLAVRTGKKINWDAAAMKAVGCPEADKFIHPEFRSGWNI
ncbi:Gfo/Idh/MocA family oxidoreductase [soil metagenome]